MTEQAYDIQSGRVTEHFAPVENHIDEEVPQLVTHAVRRGEGILASNGALGVRTGTRTGRSPKDRFIVEEPLTSAYIDWGTINQPFDPEKFEALWARTMAYLARKDEIFISHLRAGADPEHHLFLNVIAENAWHSLFARQLFIRTAINQLKEKEESQEWTIVNTPQFKTDPARDGTNSEGAVIIHLAQRKR